LAASVCRPAKPDCGCCPLVKWCQHARECEPVLIAS
jgi:adenine-specific DNA glycosylase